MKQILRQASWLVIAQIITRVIGFFYTIFLARNLGVEEFGLFSVGLAYFSIISSISDFGFNRYLILKTSQEDGKKWELLWNLLILRLTIVCVFFAIFSIFLYTFDQNKMRVTIILLSSLAVLPQSVAITFDGIFIALRRLQFSAVASIVSSASTVLIGFLLVSRGYLSLGAVNALILGQIIFAATLVLLMYSKVGIKLSEVNFSVIKKAFRGSLPYGILAILALLYFRIDILFLTYIRGNFEAGLYGAAYKFLEAIIFVPSSLATALFPILTRLHDVDIKKIRPLYFNSIKIMFFVGLIIAFLYLTILPVVVRTLLPNFLPSIDAIKILSLSIPFIFIHIPGAQVLLSTNKYLRSVLKLSILTLSFNVILNLIFIPKFGLLAASWITVASEILSFMVFFKLLKAKVL